jgi:hypothetical protein
VAAVAVIPQSTPHMAWVSAATTTPITTPPTIDQPRRPGAESGRRAVTLET